MSITDALITSGNARQVPNACMYCSGSHTAVIHGGPCPRVKAIEYHQNGTVKRVEFHGEGEPSDG